MRPARVLGHVAADRADDLARRVGRVEEAGPDRRGDVRVRHARLDADAAVLEVDLQDPLHPREDDQHAVLDRQRAAREARARPAGDPRHLDARAGGDDLPHLLGGAGQHGRGRRDVVLQQAVRLVGAQLVLVRVDPLVAEDPAQLRDQLAQVALGRLRLRRVGGDGGTFGGCAQTTIHERIVGDVRAPRPQPLVLRLSLRGHGGRRDPCGRARAGCGAGRAPAGGAARRRRARARADRRLARREGGGRGDRRGARAAGRPADARRPAGGDVDRGRPRAASADADRPGAAGGGRAAGERRRVVGAAGPRAWRGPAARRERGGGTDQGRRARRRGGRRPPLARRFGAGAAARRRLPRGGRGAGVGRRADHRAPCRPRADRRLPRRAVPAARAADAGGGSRGGGRPRPAGAGAGVPRRPFVAALFLGRRMAASTWRG